MDHRAHAALIPWLAVQIVNKIEGTLGIGRAFHIHAHEVSWLHGNGFGNQPTNDIPRHFFVYIEAHVGELDTDVGVEVPGADFVENLFVELGAVAGFFGVGDVFAEVIEGNVHAEFVDGLRGGDGVLNRRAGNESAGELLTDG